MGLGGSEDVGELFDFKGNRRGNSHNVLRARKGGGIRWPN